MKMYDEQETAIRTETSKADQPEMSVFLPVFNEEPNLRPLHAKLDEALKALDAPPKLFTSTMVPLMAV